MKTSPEELKAGKILRQRQYYAENRERILLAKRVKYRDDPDERQRLAVRKKLYYEAHKDRARQLNCTPERRAYHLRRYYADHENKKARMREYWAKNRKYFTAKFKQWAQEHPERMREHSRKKWATLSPQRKKLIASQRTLSGKSADQRHRRRAKTQGLRYAECETKIRLLKLLPFCQYCYANVIGKIHIDHVVPLTRGGEHVPANLAASCRSCNASKGNRLVSEWTWRPAFKEAA